MGLGVASPKNGKSERKDAVFEKRAENRGVFEKNSKV
jgi:hypothetical protein